MKFVKKYIVEQSHEIPVAGNYDVVVCGGGPAGTMAAIASARLGAKTLLIESSGCLGGTWTSGLLGWIMDHENKGGILSEIKNELMERNGGFPAAEKGCFACDIETVKTLLEEKCIEAGVKIRLYSSVSGVIKKTEREIGFIISESKSGREAWGGKIFIDASGDGDIGAAAGCAFDEGNPENGTVQPMSMLCLLTGIKFDDVKKFVIGYGSYHEVTVHLRSELMKAGVVSSYSRPSLFHIGADLFILMSNHEYSRKAGNADDITMASIEARAEIRTQINALRALGGIWKNLRLVSTAPRIGTREGRRIKGLYEVNAEDLKAGHKFHDGICRVNFGIDVHSQKNSGLEEPPFTSMPYDIPLRALIARDISNLLLAGRCISGDFWAHSSYRVMGNAAVTGEAAGVLAAVTVKEGCKASEIPAEKIKFFLQTENRSALIIGFPL